MRYFHIIILIVFPAFLQAQHFDIDLLKKINPDTLSGQKFWKQTSNSIYWLPAAVSLGQIGYGLAKDDKLFTRYGVETAVSAGIGQLLSTGMKFIFNRPRPYASYPNDIHPENYGLKYSFPSGHTAAAFSTASSLWFTRKQVAVSVPITLWAGGVGFSRMRLGRHYPTDVLGGIAVGILSGVAGHWVTGRLYND